MNYIYNIPKSYGFCLRSYLRKETHAFLANDFEMSQGFHGFSPKLIIMTIMDAGIFGWRASPTMPRHILDFYLISARKFKLNNDFSCSDNKKNGRNLPTESMLCAITSLLVKFRKSLYMAFKDDTSVENTRPFLRFYIFGFTSHIRQSD